MTEFHLLYLFVRGNN